MDAFHDAHPDWKTRATFFIIAQAPTLPQPFYQKKYTKTKLDFLVKEGYDIGNHTVHHPRMNKLSDASATQEIAGCVTAIHKYLKSYDVDTLALPYGLFPKNPKVVISGESDGHSYHNICAVAAGWRPAPSPVCKGFKPYYLERIQAGLKQGESHYWLNYLEAHKARKFVSDGDPTTYTVNAAYAKHVDKARLKELGFELRVYGEGPSSAKKSAIKKTKSGLDQPATKTQKPDKSKKDLTPGGTGGYTVQHN
jgi:hypothetical protein